MSIAAVVRALVEAGATPQMILAAVEAAEASGMDAIASRRANDAERQKRRRERNVNHVTSRDAHVTDRDPLPPETKVPPDPLKNSTPNPLPPSPPKGGSSPVVAFPKSNGFARFWEAYPEKVGKRAAELAYDRALRRIAGPDPPSVILAGVDRAKASRKWSQGFVPNPATWLNQDRWNDEPDPSSCGQPDARRPDPVPSAKRAAHEANMVRALRGAEIAAQRASERG